MHNFLVLRMDVEQNYQLDTPIMYDLISYELGPMTQIFMLICTSKISFQLDFALPYLDCILQVV